MDGAKREISLTLRFPNNKPLLMQFVYPICATKPSYRGKQDSDFKKLDMKKINAWKSGMSLTLRFADGDLN